MVTVEISKRYNLITGGSRIIWFQRNFHTQEIKTLENDFQLLAMEDTFDKWNERIFEDDKKRYKHFIQGLRKKGFEEIKYRVEIMGEGLIWVREKFMFSNYDNNVLCMLEDVDERMNTEFAMEAFKSWNRAEELLNKSAHDIQDPIKTILGLIYVVKKELDIQEADDKIIDVFSMISYKCNSILDYTNDILEITSLEEEGNFIQKDYVNAHDFLNFFVKTHNLMVSTKKHVLHLENNIQKDTKIKINQSKISRVLENLLSNAIKYSESFSNIIFGGHENEEDVIITIEDEGIGMSEEMMKNLFVKYGKSRRLGLQGESSTGIGLSIVKKIIDLHDGKIEIQSVEGKGTKCFIYLRKSKDY
ncbi:MAG: HAMP domain-containing histidine kinase [Cyclobacteriaceae bacterium]|nr:HAMP domain-containing histidine kinase [Cyclobacteriaceae bacterium]